MIIGFCIGNGMSIDLQKTFHNELSEFDTYNFFDWSIKSPGKDSAFLDDLPILKERLTQRIDKGKDFEFVEAIIDECKSRPNSYIDNLLLCELQHYIAHAFSAYQIAVDKINISKWRWTKWFDVHRDNLGFFVSYNYDLVLEKALEATKIGYRRVGPINEKEGICILKPHGSIDFELAPGCISIPLSYPLKSAVFNNNAPIISLDRTQWSNVRTEVDIVLPNEYSTQLEYQWIKPGYDVIRMQGNLFTHFVFSGISYCKYDRDEIDFILKSLNPNTEIIIVNPKPNQEFLEVLKNKFDSIEIWKSELRNIK